MTLAGGYANVRFDGGEHSAMHRLIFEFLLKTREAIRNLFIENIWTVLGSVASPWTLRIVAEHYLLQEVIRYTCQDVGLTALFSEPHHKDKGIDASHIYSALKIPKQSTRVLLLAACSFKLLRKRADKYYATKLLLAPIAMENFDMKVYFPGLFFFPESCKSGTNAGLQVLPGDGKMLEERIAAHPDLENYYAENVAIGVLEIRLPLILEALKRTPRKIEHVLDVGGNTGVVASAIINENSHMRVTVFDLPSVVSRAEATTANIQFVAGDAFSDPFPSADCILFSSFFEFIPEQKIQQLLQKAYAALSTDGAVIIVQFACNDLETGPVVAAVRSMYFFNIFAPGTMTYPRADFRRWAKEIGFRSFEAVSSNKNAPGAYAMVLCK
jgi:ubiquinone/menaquinone biosynthesis C-methylase UbiE